MTRFTDYQPREHWTLRIPAWRFALYLVIAYCALCVLASGCSREQKAESPHSGQDSTMALPSQGRIDTMKVQR
jgi:hypothetical protein